MVKIGNCNLYDFSAGLAKYGEELGNKYGAPLEQEELDILHQHDRNVSFKDYTGDKYDINKINAELCVALSLNPGE